MSANVFIAPPSLNIAFDISDAGLPFGNRKFCELRPRIALNRGEISIRVNGAILSAIFPTSGKE